MAARSDQQLVRGEEQPLLQGLRSALRSGEPLDFLAVVSGFMEVTDPRRRDPFSRDEQHPDLSDLVESFIGTPFAETTAALTAIRTLTADQVLAARIGRELATRRHPLPGWLTELDRASVETDVWFLTDVLGDGDDYLFGVTLTSGQALSCLVYVDHNLGAVVKDAFVVPETLEDLALKVGTTIEAPDQSLTRTDPALARAVVTEAIDTGSRLYPPLESDSWPMCRPLVEWMLRKLPAGGVVPPRKEWSEAETSAIAADFLASPHGRAFDHEDGRSLLTSLLWFGTDYTAGDPYRWSAVAVEILLTDWVPRKIIATPSYLAQLPALLRAYIGYCHERQGIRPALTRETLHAVDRYEPDYQRTIRTERPQGPAALLAQMFEARDALGHDEDGDDEDWDDEDERSVGEIMLQGLDLRVGGRIVLQNLDAASLPDEPFEWAGIAEDVRPVVRSILELCDRCANQLLDVEHRTAMRRFLSRAAVADPAIFRRKASPERGAAAVAWVICRANDTVASSGHGMAAQDLLSWFGLKGSVSKRAEPLLRANGVDPHRLYGSMALGVPDLLTGEYRAQMIAMRDRWTGR